MGDDVTDEGRAILDTNVVIADHITPIPGLLTISAATVAELHFGVLVARTDSIRAERLRRLSALQRRFDPLPLDDAVAASYGLLAAAVVKVGRQPRARTMDLIIAATAHAHNARLYTRNVDDFLGLEDLVEVVPI
ncbi:type II toxin-antitoxin system VapC family toxin [Nocardia sp. NBC_01388]|uniref:type II toxin-antitoxin system VapC family toxin n=1 Tax=Nocardia sp. NBC_01388 TaxID=2903596 RepID=UPI003246BB37